MKKTWAAVLAKCEETRKGETTQVLSFAESAWQGLRIGAVLGALLIGGCTVGPDFKKPAAPDVTDYTAKPLTKTVATAGVAGGEAQRFSSGSDIPGDWWTLFHSRPLNDLIEHSLTNNADLKAAQAALTVARENVLAQRGAF